MVELWERSPIADSPVSLVVTGPSQGLRATLEGVGKAAKGRTYEVLVPVAPTLAADYESQLQNLSLTRLITEETVSRGVGAALRVGIAAAKHPLVMTLPVGYDAAVLNDYLKEIDLVDIVCGSRRGTQKGWKWRQFFSVSYQIFGLWLQDPECPVRLYRREIFELIPIQSNSSFAQIEILAKANFESKLLAEVPIDGPLNDLPRDRSDVWRVINHPDFGPPPQRVIDAAAKPIFTTKCPGSTALRVGLEKLSPLSSCGNTLTSALTPVADAPGSPNVSL